jgi:hypothetical protein
VQRVAARHTVGHTGSLSWNLEGRPSDRDIEDDSGTTTLDATDIPWWIHGWIAPCDRALSRHPLQTHPDRLEMPSTDGLD